ncbi:TPA: SMI1/KNR4 family protein, partial [Bacillus cereus]|nr:SMI1/KNR4 family protein [Bacillus cereus]
MINLSNIPDLIEKSAASDIEIQAVENRMNVT